MQQPTIYRLEECTFPAKPPFLAEEVYDQALSTLVRVCTDIILAIPQKKSICLAKRIIPFRGWWAFGGRVFPGETLQASAKRCLERELGLSFEEERFQFLRENRYMYLGPKGTPRDDATSVFLVECTVDEINSARHVLDKEEYDVLAGIRLFDHPTLRNPLYKVSKVAQPILDIYDMIFP